MFLVKYILTIQTVSLGIEKDEGLQKLCSILITPNFFNEDGRKIPTTFLLELRYFIILQISFVFLHTFIYINEFNTYFDSVKLYYLV